MKPIFHKYPKVRRYFSRASSLLMMFQKSPIIQMILPEARLLSSVASADAVKMTIATIAGLGVFDSVTGATEVVQLAPSTGNTVPSTSGEALTFVFQAINIGGEKVKSFQVTGTLPAGLSLTPGVTNNTIGTIVGTPTESGTFPNIQIRGYENSNNTGRYAQGIFTIVVQPGAPIPASIVTHPSSTTTFLGESASLNVVAAGSPPLTYQWYQGPQGNITSPVGSNSDTLNTGALTATTIYWVKVSNAENPGGAQSNAATVTLDPRFEYCAASHGGSILSFSGSIQSGHLATHAIDGIIDNNNRWAVTGFPNSIEIDLGENKSITRTEYYPYKGRSYQYEVEAKYDGGTYAQVVNRINNQTIGTDHDENPITDEISPVIARYIKVTIYDIGNSTSSTCSINEFKAYGIPADEQLAKDWNENHFSGPELSDPAISGDNADPDHDHISNADEYIFGTSPKDSTGQLIPVIDDHTGQFAVSFTAKKATGAGYTGKTRHYAIEVTNDLTQQASWATLTGYSDIVGSDQGVSASIPNAGVSKKFYRIKTWLTP